MQILETLVVEQTDGLFGKLAEALPFIPITDLEIPVFRMEVNPDVVILVYKLNDGQQVSDVLMEHVLPHVKSAVFLANREAYSEWQSSPRVTELLPELEKRAAVVIALATSPEWTEQMADYIAENGMYLAERSRLMFWNPEERESLLQVWKKCWGDLLLSS